MLADGGWSIPCVDTSSHSHSPDSREREGGIVEGERMADLVAFLGSPGIRVFGDTIQTGTDRVSTRHWIVDSIRKLADRNEPKGVEIWIETHGHFATSAETITILTQTGGKNVGVVWHPANGFIEANERPCEADRAQRTSLHHVHLKDLRCLNGQWEPVLTGEETLPVPEFLAALQTFEYDRFLSFEWEKKHPGIREPGMALAHFVQWFRKN